MTRIVRGQATVGPPAGQPGMAAAAVPQENAGRMASDRLEREAPAPRNLRTLKPYLQDQNEGGRTNGCGTTSLAMLLSAWKGEPGAYTRDGIDAAIRRFNAPTTPQNVVDYARAQGFRAAAKNGASVEDLLTYVDQGAPVQVMYDPDGNGQDATLHYVVVTDYEKDEDGKLTDLIIADPWGGEEKRVPIAEFRRRWDKLQINGRDTGFDNLMIPILPEEDTALLGKDGQVRRTDDIRMPRGGNLGWRAMLADKLFDAANAAGHVTDAVKSLRIGRRPG